MKYRKTALIEATQWFDWGDHPAVEPYAGQLGIVKGIGPYGWVKTLEGGHIVTPGDWIATGVKGEHWPIKPDVFAATYEPVDVALSASPPSASVAAILADVERRAANAEVSWKDAGSPDVDRCDQVRGASSFWAMMAFRRLASDLRAALASASPPAEKPLADPSADRLAWAIGVAESRLRSRQAVGTTALRTDALIALVRAAKTVSASPPAPDAGER